MNNKQKALQAVDIISNKLKHTPYFSTRDFMLGYGNYGTDLSICIASILMDLRAGNYNITAALEEILNEIDAVCSYDDQKPIC